MSVDVRTLCVCGHSNLMHDMRMFSHDLPIKAAPCMRADCKCRKFREKTDTAGPGGSR